MVKSNSERAWRVLRIFRLLKLLRVFKLMKLMSKWEEETGLGSAAKLGRFALTLFFFAHILGCVWMLTANNNTDDAGFYHPDTWVYRYFTASGRDMYAESSNSHLTMYLLSLYWLVESFRCF